jgi:hypothetical protein
VNVDSSAHVRSTSSFGVADRLRAPLRQTMNRAKIHRSERHVAS